MHNLLRYEGQRVLILAPHADDETIGCGGLIQKFRKAGSPIRVLIGSFVIGEYKKFNKEKGVYHIYSGQDRLQEVKSAFSRLGIDQDYHFLFVDQDVVNYHSRLDTVPKIILIDKIEAHIRDFSPTIILAPSNTKHQDHAVLHEVAHTVSRPYFWNGSLWIYETDGELSFTPNLFVPLTEEEVAVKLDALKEFKTQLGNEKHPVNPDLLTAKARYRGQSTYAKYAEAFQIIRMSGG